MPLLLFLSLSCYSDLFFGNFPKPKPRPYFPKPRLFIWDQIFWKRDIFFKTKLFQNRIFFPISSCPKPIKKPSKNWQVSEPRSFETKMSHSCRGASLSMYKSQIPRILTWGRQPVIQSAYSFHFLKAIALILTKVCSYMQKTCDVTEKAILAQKKLRKKCVNRDKM